MSQAESKFSQIEPNLAKSSQARAKTIKGKAWILLVRIEPYQGVAPTPRPEIILLLLSLLKPLSQSVVYLGARLRCVAPRWRRKSHLAQVIDHDRSIITMIPILLMICS
jgi:hypothetical protein